MAPSSSPSSDVVSVSSIEPRGVSLLTLVYTLIGASVNGASAFRIIAALLIFGVGVAYIALEAVPSISPPENMNPEGVAIHDEDVV